MTRITKLELQQINTRLATENEQLRAELSQVKADAIRHQEAAMSMVANNPVLAACFVDAPAAKPPRPAYVMPQWQVDRGLAMQAAKAQAMSTRAMVHA